MAGGLECMAVSAMTPGELLERLGGGRKVGTDWVAQCPVHADHGQSVTVTQGRNGQGRVECSAGCDFRVIMKAIRQNGGRRSGVRSPAPRRSTVHAVHSPLVPGLADVLDEVEAFIRGYVVVSDDAAAAAVLWTAHTYA